MDYVKWISAAMGSLLLWLVLAILRKYFPWRQRKIVGRQESLSEKEYQVAQIGFAVLFVVCLLLVGALLLQSYEWWLVSTVQSLPSGHTIILPDQWGYWFCIGMLAMGMGGLLSYFIMNSFLGERSTLYIEEASRRSSMNTQKIFVGLYVVILVVGIALSVLFLQNSVHIETDSIIFNEFLRADAKKYPISAITNISYARYYSNRQGKLIERPHYQIEFADGFQWSTKQFPYGIENLAHYSESFQRLADKAGIVIVSNDVIP